MVLIVKDLLILRPQSVYCRQLQLLVCSLWKLTCDFLNDNHVIRCILDFSIKDDLRGNCVLGVDFFSQYWDDVGMFFI